MTDNILSLAGERSSLKMNVARVEALRKTIKKLNAIFKKRKFQNIVIVKLNFTANIDPRLDTIRM